MHWLDLSLITALQLGVGGGVTVVVVGAAVTVGYVVRAPGVDFRHWPTFTLAEPDTCSDACMQLVARRKERESAEQAAGSAKSWSESLYWTWVALVLAAAALAAAGVAAASIPGGGVAAAILFALATAALITAAYVFGAYMKALAEYARLVQDADEPGVARLMPDRASSTSARPAKRPVASVLPPDMTRTPGHRDRNSCAHPASLRRRFC